MATRKINVVRLGFLLLPLVALGALSVLGWSWASALTCRAIEFSGIRYAERGALLEAARIDTGMTLFNIEPYLVEDRLRRHPWVRDARLLRLPSGTVSIHIDERTPLLLMLDAEGRPAHYLDADGVPMPAFPGVVFNVPLLRGLDEAPHPMQAVTHATVRALLDALAGLDAETDALISEIELKPSGEAWLYTTPAGGRGAITVRMGHGPYREKLKRLQAFWERAVLSQPDRRFELIDLRFDSQIVTHETDGAS